MTLAVVCALVLLWREVRAPETNARSDRPAEPTITTGSTPRHGGSSTGAAVAGPTDAREAATSPPGGVRAWSPTAAPTNGPDPFAPVPAIRTADDTRTGLTE